MKEKQKVRACSLPLEILGLILLLILPCSYLSAVDASPTWYVDARIIYHGQLNPYDYYAAKDPTIVYSGGKYHVFYTGANQSGGWQMLYTSASTISGLQSASRTYMSKIGESYFCAPEVFYFEPQSKWYLVYQDGTYGAAYSTTTNIADPNSWSGPYSFGISGNMGWDYYVICDDTYCYMYNSPDDGSRNIYIRRTNLASFPGGWSSPSVILSNTFEGVNVYKSLADGKYYLLSEDYLDNRYYELWTSSSAGGPWTQVAEKWAYRGNLVYNSDAWTTSVSHGELIRAGVNQKLEINNIDQVDFLIQGTTNLSGDYHNIIWDLGMIHNYTGSTTPVPTTAPIDTSAPTLISTTAPTETPAPTLISTTAPTNPPGITADPTSPPSITDPPATGCTCTNLCSSQTAISVPFTKDGAGEYCYTSSSLGSYVNSWNCDAVNINGTNYTNTFVFSSSIAAINGVFYIYYKGSYSWSHIEIK